MAVEIFILQKIIVMHLKSSQCATTTQINSNQPHAKNKFGKKRESRRMQKVAERGVEN